MIDRRTYRRIRREWVKRHPEMIELGVRYREKLCWRFPEFSGGPPSAFMRACETALAEHQAAVELIDRLRLELYQEFDRGVAWCEHEARLAAAKVKEEGI